MGRKAEPGILYYPMDCSHIRNKKVRLLYSEFGADGYWVWQCIIAAAYEGAGYYFDCNDKDTMVLFASEVCKKRVSQVEEIISGCIRRSLFDKGVADLFGVLTSAKMQEVYLDATAERRRKGTIVEIVSDYLLILPGESDGKKWENIQFVGSKIIVPQINKIVPRRNLNIPPNNPQSRVNKSKEEETYGQKPDPPAVVPAPQDLYAEYRKVGKDKEPIFIFIRDKRPQFIEPYVAFWNFFAQEYSLPKVSSITKKRRQHFAVRIREAAFNFPEILRKVKGSQFLLTGNWFGFDWLIKNDANYLKVLEGNYANKSNTQSETAANEYAIQRQKIEERTRKLSGE